MEGSNAGESVCKSVCKKYGDEAAVGCELCMHERNYEDRRNCQLNLCPYTREAQVGVFRGMKNNGKSCVENCMEGSNAGESVCKSVCKKYGDEAAVGCELCMHERNYEDRRNCQLNLCPYTREAQVGVFRGMNNNGKSCVENCMAGSNAGESVCKSVCKKY